VIKKIPISGLQAGMTLCGVGKELGDDFFFMNNILIKNEKDIIRLVQNGYTNVYVETLNNSADIHPTDTAEPLDSTKLAADCIDSGSLSFAVEPVPMEEGAGGREDVDFEDEISEARRIRDAALNAIRDVCDDMRLGKSIRKDKVFGTIDSIVESIFRNRHALTSLARLKAYDDYTFAHSVNVCILSIALGRNLDLTKEDLHVLGVGSLLHDIGKILLPADLVNKPGLYSPAERMEIQRHTSLGADFISGSEGIKEESVFVVRQHHEKNDGTGYQSCLKGEEIHLFARIAGLTDMYDAMTTDRIYRKSLLPTDVLKILYLRRKEYFEPSLVENFICSIGIYPIGSMVELNTGEAGLVTSVNQARLTQPGILVVFDKDKRLYGKPFKVNLKDEEKLRITGIFDPKSRGFNADGLLR